MMDHTLDMGIWLEIDCAPDTNRNIHVLRKLSLNNLPRPLKIEIVLEFFFFLLDVKWYL